MFNPGTEVVTYLDRMELTEKTKYYLAHPERAESIRESGYRRALQCHTYHHRYRVLFEHLGLLTDQ